MLHVFKNRDSILILSCILKNCLKQNIIFIIFGFLQHGEKLQLKNYIISEVYKVVFLFMDVIILFPVPKKYEFQQFK